MPSSSSDGVARGDASFGRDRRVRKRSEFQRAQSAARRVTTAHYVLLVAPQGGDPRPARLGLIVTKKIGDAVTRNRIKRVCRECFRHRDWLPEGVDLVVVARPGSEALGFREVEAEWAGVSGLLKRRASEVRQGAAHVPLAPDGPKAHVSRARGPKPPAPRRP